MQITKSKTTAPIFLVRPQHEDAWGYLEEVTDGQWFGGALAVEHRYIKDLVAGLQRDGYTVI